MVLLYDLRASGEGRPAVISQMFYFAFTGFLRRPAQTVAVQHKLRLAQTAEATKIRCVRTPVFNSATKNKMFILVRLIWMRLDGKKKHTLWWERNRKSYLTKLDTCQKVSTASHFILMCVRSKFVLRDQWTPTRLMRKYVTHNLKKQGCEIKIHLRVCRVFLRWTLSILADEAYERLPCLCEGGLTSLDQFPSGLLASGFKWLDGWITNTPLLVFYLLVSI